MQEWLTNVNALTGGKLPVDYACHNSDVSVSTSIDFVVRSSAIEGTALNSRSQN